MTLPTRDELKQLLSQQRALTVDRELFHHVVAYLNEHWDFELVSLTETAFGRPLHLLRTEAQKVVPQEFMNVVQTHCPIISDYLKYTEQNEAPSVFHALAFLATTSAAMGRRWYIQHDFYQVYPPIAAVLVGPSGLRKTTAINTALRLIRNAPDLTVIEEKATAEGIIRRLKSVPQGQPVHALIVAPEMAVMFGKALHLQSLVPVITRGLDHDKLQHTTVSGGTVELEDVTLGLLAGTTATWITEEMNISVVSGGFTSRLLFSYEETSARVFFKPKSLSGQQFASIKSHIFDNVLQLPRGEMRLDNQAEILMNEWYHHHHSMLPKKDDLMASYMNRKATHLLRLALVITLLNCRSSIDVVALQGAINILEFLEPGMKKLFAELALPISAVDARRILLALREGPIPFNQLRAEMAEQIPVQRLNEILTFLVDTGQLQVNERGMVCVA